AHMNLGEYAQADSIHRIVERSRERLPPTERHLLDFGLAISAGDQAGKLRAARQVVALLPGSEWHYLQGFAAVGVNRPREALETLRRTDPRHGWLDGWTGYWSVLTNARHMLGQHRRELKEAQQARAQYPELLSTLSYEVQALAALGRMKEVNERLDESLALPPERSWSAGRVMLNAANELRAHGKTEAAQQAANRAVAWYTAQPAKQQGVETHRYGLGLALYQAGRWSEARTLFQSLAAEKPDNVSYQGYLGVVAARTGDRATAARISQALGSLDRPYLFGQYLYWQARIAAVLGERERAVTLLTNAYTEGRSYDASVHAEMDFESLRGYPPFRELLRPKG
ncbi:MAG: tetratricopeptide repeat protein, partial [Gemmatimonadota bacterium]|nr:tetratricopeptide repeat protein [Gemmatimonadota bacterium]